MNTMPAIALLPRVRVRARARVVGRVSIMALVIVLAWTNSVSAAEKKGKKEPVEPDYTKGEVMPERGNLWMLGPLGASAEIWGVGTGDVTRNTRMLLVTSAVKGTPADGVLEAKDVILGVIAPVVGGGAPNKGDVRFTSDARKAMAAAVTEAEKKDNKGNLVLNIWRKGKVMPVTLTLPVKGSFSDTAPWECEKTKLLIDEAAQYIVKQGFTSKRRGGGESVDGDLHSLLDALGLLATGEEKYLPVVRDFAKAMSDASLNLSVFPNPDPSKKSTGIGTWMGAYRNIFLAEYYLATKDAAVIPGITALSTYLALGQSGVGTWSHGIADVVRNGLYGPAAAYGAMNQCSITAAMSLVLAQKCGIKKKEIDDAVVRSKNFYLWFVDKGTPPYGDHTPAEYHDNNGKSSQTAVFFDLLGEKEATEFFTRMALASYNQRERGHTGHFFSWLWGALGAARGGPAAAQSFIKNTRWFTELERRADGGYIYQPQLADQDHNKHRNWSTTGTRLLQHCLPRKALYITGKGGSSIPPIVADDLKAAVDAATFDPTGLSTKELLTALGNWSIIVRKEAARELGKREDNVVKELIAMLESPNRYARYGACLGLENAGRQSDEAVNALMKHLTDNKDMTFRFFIVNALKFAPSSWKPNGLGVAVKKATNDLLKLAATQEQELDPMRKIQGEIGDLMFGGKEGDFVGVIGGKSKDQAVDRQLLIQAIKSLLQNPNGGVRSATSEIFDDLSDEDLRYLWGDIYHATKYPAPSGVMFSGKVRINGAKIMANKHIKEGLDVGAQYVFRTEAWGALDRGIDGVPALKPYGQALKEFFPDIEKFSERVNKQGRPPEKKAYYEAYEYMKKNPAPPLTSIEQYLKEFYSNQPPEVRAREEAKGK